MASRTRQNPGVELNEIDRSFYGKVDNSLPNSPTSLVVGFADQGEDMTLEWIDSKATLDETFGTPSTEFESFMYNAAMEILNRGGSCIASKLPYQNEQFQRYNYVDFDVSKLITITSNISAPVNYETIGDIHDSLSLVLQQLSSYQHASIETINGMANAIRDIYSNSSSISSLDEDDLATIGDLSASLSRFISSYMNLDKDFPLLYLNDTNLTSYLKISVHSSAKKTEKPKYGANDSIESLDNLITHQKGCLSQNTIRVYDITRAKYQSIQNGQCVSCEALSTWTNECLGIVPVIVTPANAMYFQNLLQFNGLLDDTAKGYAAPDYEAFNNLSTFSTIALSGIYQDESNMMSQMSIPLASTAIISGMSLIDIDSLSRRSAKQFPPINFYDAGHFDKTNLKKIGVIVFKAFRDTGNFGKISFQMLESFVGALDKNAQDETTKANIFIDNVVNQNSQFIRLFSNVDASLVEQATTYAMSRQPAVSLGFYKQQCTKDISFINSIVRPLTMILDKASNTNNVPLDIVIDAGVSNIAQLAKIQVTSNGVLHTDDGPTFGDYDWPFGYANSDISGWKAVLSKFDNFCKNIRKDCMFIADGLRPLCLTGNSKIVRPTKPENTVANSIIPNFKYIVGAIDSSYSAGYCNWYLQPDYSNVSNYVWIPPSIKAAGVYIYCDTYFHPWSAPAGHTRGIVNDAIDVAFIPSNDDSGIIYNNAWNYAMSYPMTGVVIEGHKTFQSQRTALDRINVRRLMLYLEKAVARIAQAFVYEQNTPYTRQLLVDAIRPVLDDAVSGNGISEYGIKCDDEINTTNVIENNEMRCKIAVRPIKVVDWIVINLICTNQSASITEELAR